jgi:hypothetical protein
MSARRATERAEPYEGNCQAQRPVPRKVAPSGSGCQGERPNDFNVTLIKSRRWNYLDVIQRAGTLLLMDIAVTLVADVTRSLRSARAAAIFDAVAAIPVSAVTPAPEV